MTKPAKTRILVPGSRVQGGLVSAAKLPDVPELREQLGRDLQATDEAESVSSEELNAIRLR